MRFERLLRKNFWTVWLLLLAGGAFFTARAFSQGLGIILAADEKQLGAAPLVMLKSGSAAKSAHAHVTDGSGILARNPFDHTTGPLSDEPVDDTSSSGPVVDNNSDPTTDPLCDGVTVMAIAASSDPDWSFAAFTAPGDPKSVLRRRGQEVGGKQIHYIRWDRVWMMNGHTRCQAKLFGKGAAPAAAPVADTPPPKGGAPSASADLAKGIQKIGPREYNIDRGTVDKILENQAELMKMARIVPEKEGDKIVGIRLFGVRPDTMLGLIGLENGDRLQTINGFDIANPEKALEAYARLRSAEKLTVQVNRGGKNMNLDYNVR